jgi:PAS domain S-box-containing protein
MENNMTDTSSLSPEMLCVFETVPDLYLILSPDLVILTASDAYLSATYKERDAIRGKHFFEVFPALPDSDATADVRSSLEWVLQHRQPHQMPLQRYDVTRPEQPGGFEGKHWLTTNTPVLGSDGNIRYIIHKVDDYPKQVQTEQQIEAPERQSGSPLKSSRDNERIAQEVTELVVARKQVEQSENKSLLLYHELTTANKVVEASNEKLITANQELLQTQEALRELNREQEEQVEARTKVIQLATAKTVTERNRLQQILMQAAAPICILDGADFIYELVNPAYQQLLPGRALLGNSLLKDALSEVASLPFADALRHVYRTGETIETREELIPVARHEGGPLEERYFNYTLQARRNEQGQIDGIIIFAFEVTEQVETRKAVERSAERLQLITDALPALIGYLDKEEKYRFANKAYEAWFNRNPKDLLGRPVREVVGEKAYQGVKKYIDRALAGERLDFESRMPYREDFVKHIHTSYVPETRDGEVVGFFTLVNDATEQVEALQKVEEREKEASALAEQLSVVNEDLSRSIDAFQMLNQQQLQLVTLVEESTDFIGMATPSGKGVYINRAGLELVGLEEAQVKEVEILDFFHEEEKPFVRDVILPTLLKEGRWGNEFRLRHFKTGERIPVYYNCFSVKDPSTDVLLGFATIIIDITERKKQEAELQALSKEVAAANEELRMANEQLTRTNVDLDNFIYTASHDLKAPIFNIQGLIQVLIDSLPTQLLASYGLEEVIGMIEMSIKRFMRTIDHLTEVTKLQKENNQDAVLVNIAEVIQEVRLDLSPQLEAAGAQLEVAVDDCVGISLSEKNLRSVVYNLISNAVKYHAPDRAPKVQVSCRQEAEHVVLTVRDNGLGMDLSGNQKLFTMFERLHDHVEGSGIGLYMVKKIVENAGGRIRVESQPGVGTTFTVYFRS